VSTSSINDDNAYLSSPYQVFSDSNYTLEVTRLRLNWTDRAYVNVLLEPARPDQYKPAYTTLEHSGIALFS